MSQVKLVLKGLHENHYLDDGSYIIDPLSSSVTLIQVNNKNILVDAGTPNFKTEIIQNLAKENLILEDIDYLLLTHNHLDHTFNAHLFPNALVYTSMSFWHWQETKCHIYPKGTPEDSILGIKLFKTPGHSIDSMSIFIEDGEGKRWVIAGDAINIHYLDNNTLRQRVGEDGVKSIQTILNLNPDYIIPGHGEILGETEIERLKVFLKASD